MLDRLNLLVSRQIYERGDAAAIIAHYGSRLRLMVDCGAYIDYVNGLEPWPVSRYIAWLNRLVSELRGTGIEIDGYMALDVIGDGDATLANYEEMLDAGFSPIPILTRGASDVHLQRFLDTSDRLALGGIFGGTADKAALRLMISRLPAGYRQHWLGFMQHDFVAHYKPESVDTSTWARSLRWGDIFVYEGQGKSSLVRDYRLTITRPQRSAIRRLGFDPAKLLRANRKSMDNPDPIGDCLSVASYLAFARDLERVIGTRYFFAMAYSGMMNLMLMQRFVGGSCPGATTAADRIGWMASSPPAALHVPAERVCPHQ